MKIGASKGKRKWTRDAYESHLNEISPPFESDQWIIGGQCRRDFAHKSKYGTAIRKHDPIVFNVGYNEWIRPKAVR